MTSPTGPPTTPPAHDRASPAPARDDTLHVDLLGRFHIWTAAARLENDRDAIALNRKAALLLAHLAFYSHRMHPRDTLAELLWPDMEAAAARNNLRVSLSRLNRVLTDLSTLSAIPRSVPLFRTADRSFLALNPARWATTDVARFEAALLRADSVKGAPDSVTETGALETAVDSYGGHLLPGYNEPWVDAERHRLEERYLAALRRLVQLTADGRQYDRALEYARRALAVDPLRQGAHRDLMRLHLLTGRPDAALRQLSDLEALLARSPGSPALSPATKALGEQIVAATTSGSSWPNTGSDGTGASGAGNETSADDGLLVGRTPDDAFPAAFGLPTSRTRLFGREAEAAEVVRLLIGVADDPLTRRRLVSLIGVGGSGKTRLAERIAHDLWRAGPFAGSVWWLAVSDVSASDSLLTALANRIREVTPTVRHGSPAALSPANEPETPLKAVAAALLALATGRESSPADIKVGGVASRPTEVLLVLDNAEAFLEDSASLIEGLLELVPSLSCMVTSRVPLGLGGEQSFPLPMLPCRLDPTDSLDANLRPMVDATTQSGALLEVPALQLFADRARLVRLQFTLTALNAREISALCMRLDGNPLAIELAAAWTRTMTPGQILARLETGRFSLLVHEGSDMPDRHRSLWSIIESSERLLSDEVRRLFRQLSVFRGGFTLRAAMAVCIPGCDETLLLVLCDHSLILPRGDGRFDMIETIRQFANAHLAPRERLALQRRHAQYCLSVMDGTFCDDMDRHGESMPVRVGRSLDNIRAALDWCTTATDADDLALGLQFAGIHWRYWMYSGQFHEGRARLGGILRHAEAIEQERPGSAPPSKIWVGAVMGAGTLAVNTGDMETGEAHYDRAIHLAKAIQLPETATVATLISWGVTHERRGDLRAAQTKYERCIAICQNASDDGSHSLYALALANLGTIHSRRGEYSAAHRLYEQAYELACHLESRPMATEARRYKATTLTDLAYAETWLGEYAIARRHLRESRELLESLRDQVTLLRLRYVEADWALQARKDAIGAAAAFHNVLSESWERGDPSFVLGGMDGLCRALKELGNYLDAGTLLGGLQRLIEHYRVPFTDFEVEVTRKLRVELESLAGAQKISQAWEQGYSMTPEHIVECALRRTADLVGPAQIDTAGITTQKSEF